MPNRSIPGSRPLTLAGILLTCLLSGQWLSAQPGTRIDLPKPEKFQNRTLASEKTGTGRIPIIKKFQQNIVTKYNFHFNAENELNDALGSVRQAHKDDYNRLLTFFDHSPEEAAGQKEELDSVILKCNNGILLHDLRNDWVDDLYLLMGKAYYLKNELDSAFYAFQYINYAFQPRSRSEYGYEKTIGSRLDGNGDVQSIASQEKKGLIPRVLLHTPVRNDAILWMLRTLIEQQRMNEAGGLIELLRADRSLPNRLKDGLSELQAYWFYKTGQHDSAAHYLEKSLDLASTPRERARSEFLAAQLYALSTHPREAGRMYEKVIAHTTDPVMEAYARIHRMNLLVSEQDSSLIGKNIDELIRMSRKARYEEYRHIIHYAAARLEMQRDGYSAAIDQLRNSLKSNVSDASFKGKVFLELGNLAFDHQDYVLARDSYDSLQAGELTGTDSIRVNFRKPILSALVYRLEQLRREDSLQHIADLPEAERKAYVHNLSKKLRKEQGLKEEDTPSSGAMPTGMPGMRDNEPVNLFASNESKGEWYFYNPGLRNQGFRLFQSKWGKRPNIDNWRRQYAVNAQLNAAARGLNPPDMNPDGQVQVAAATQTQEKMPEDISEDGMMSALPLTDELRRASNDTIQSALFHLGRIFGEELDECEAVIKYLTALLDRFPSSVYTEQALYQLSVCYRQRGDAAKTNFYRNHLARVNPTSPLLSNIDDPKKAATRQESERVDATRQYEEVYQRMISGKFEEAFALKRAADSTYGSRYWTDQLLYIEAIYHVSRRADSMAVLRLETLKNRKGTVLSAKAETMLDVLKRRNEIEAYLTQLEIKRYPEDSLILPEEPVVVRKQEPVVPTVTPVPADSTTAMVQAPAIPVPADSARKPMADTVARTARVPGSYHFEPTDRQAVVLLLDDVDPVYRNEARVGLTGYNRAQFPDLPLTIRVDGFNDAIRLLIIEGFGNLAEALRYLELVKKASATDIFPWMPADKYRYFPVSAPDLPLFLEKKDERGYLEFLRKHLPGKF